MVTRRLRVVLAVMCILGLSGTISSHEVPVHWKITERAIDYLAVSRPELRRCAANLKIRLGEGVGAEDDYYEPQSRYLPHGNFMFHFTPRLEDLFLTSFGVATAHTNCDSMTWGHAGLGQVCSATSTDVLRAVDSGPRTNAHSYSQIVADLKTTPGSAVHNRGLKGLGHYLHLLQDLASPAHTRNDAHPHLFSILSFKHLGDPSLFEVVNKGRDVPLPTRPLIKTWTSPEQAFSDLQQFTSTRFWSEKATLKDASGPALRNQLNGYAYDDERRPIAYRPWFLNAWTINDVVAQAQFDELAPEAVRYTASMIDYIIETQKVTLCDAEPFTGTWSGTYTFGSMSAVLEETDSVVSGEITDAVGCVWRVSGSTSGSQLSLPTWTLLSNPAPPVCIGGTVTMSGALVSSPTAIIRGTGSTVLATGATIPWTFTLILE